MKGRDRTESK